MSRCVVIVPMLGRAEQVERLVDSLAASTGQARCLFVVTDTDTAVREAVADHDHLIVPPRQRGAVLEHVPDAHYLATVRSGSRNRSVANQWQLHRAIREAAR